MRIHDGSQAGKAVIHVKKQVLGKGRVSWCCIFKSLSSCPIFKKTTALERTAIVSLQEIETNLQISDEPRGLSPPRHSSPIQSPRLLLVTQESI